MDLKGISINVFAADTVKNPILILNIAGNENFLFKSSFGLKLD